MVIWTSLQLFFASRANFTWFERGNQASFVTAEAASGRAQGGGFAGRVAGSRCQAAGVRGCPRCEAEPGVQLENWLGNGDNAGNTPLFSVRQTRSRSAKGSQTAVWEINEETNTWAGVVLSRPGSFSPDLFHSRASRRGLGQVLPPRRPARGHLPCFWVPTSSETQAPGPRCCLGNM